MDVVLIHLGEGHGIYGKFEDELEMQEVEIWRKITDRINEYVKQHKVDCNLVHYFMQKDDIEDINDEEYRFNWTLVLIIKCYPFDFVIGRKTDS